MINKKTLLKKMNLVILVLFISSCELFNDIKEVERPEISVKSGIYGLPQMVIINCNTSDSVIFYTIDGTEPDNTSNIYSEPLEISEDTYLKVIAEKSGMKGSSIAESKINFKVSEPIFSVKEGSYKNGFTLELSNVYKDAIIYYTTDYSTPSDLSTLYEEPILIHKDTVIKARVFYSKWEPSEICEAYYNITTVTSPYTNINPGVYNASFSTYLLCREKDSVIYYTTDGSEPDINSSKISPVNPTVSITGNTVLKTFSVKEGMDNSPVVQYDFILQSEKPKINIAGGEYNNPQTIYLSTSTPKGVIYYTLDGSVPTAASVLYSGPLKIESDTSIKAVVIKENWDNSEILEEKFVFRVKDLSINYKSDYYTQAINILLESETSDIEIRYTLDGSEPDKDSTLYQGPILIDRTQTLKAIGIKDGWNPSSIITEEFRIWKLTTLAGIAGSHSFSDGTGIEARFNKPTSLVFDSEENIIVSDSGNHRLRKVTKSGIVTTIAGTGLQGYSNGEGIALAASFNNPTVLAIDSSDNIYVYDRENNAIRCITNLGEIYDFYVFPSDSGKTVVDMEFDTDNNLYIIESLNIKKITPDKIVSNINPRLFPPNTAGYNGATGFVNLSSICIDKDNNIYITASSPYERTLFEIHNDGGVSTLYGYSNPNPPSFSIGDVEVDRDNKLYVYLYDGYRDYKSLNYYNPSTRSFTLISKGIKGSGADGVVNNATIIPGQYRADPSGNRFYMLDYGNSTIRVVSWN